MLLSLNQSRTGLVRHKQVEQEAQPPFPPFPPWPVNQRQDHMAAAMRMVQVGFSTVSSVLWAVVEVAVLAVTLEAGPIPIQAIARGGDGVVPMSEIFLEVGVSKSIEV